MIVNKRLKRKWVNLLAAPKAVEELGSKGPLNKGGMKANLEKDEKRGQQSSRRS